VARLPAAEMELPDVQPRLVIEGVLRRDNIAAGDGAEIRPERQELASGLALGELRRALEQVCAGG